MRTLAVLSILTLVLTVPSFAQVAGATCLGIDNDIERLQCFDTEVSVAAQGVEARSCTEMSLDDFRLDAKILYGQCVILKGQIMDMGGMSMMTEGMMDMNPIMINSGALDRTGRKILLECNAGCRVSITGTVEDVFMQTGVRAEVLRRL